MTNDYRIEMARIDLEARRMRAETLRGLFAGMSARIRGLFAAAPAAGRAA
ncbi:hypothetical protein SAMN05444336_10663 [Albimonas donghaensis]|uniref:Uncharacterized protein n=1 Tax=Albimonas donghaensis TaxID=356660 RepID=A0A1H3CDU4_9RHOB|nr:hypothetical protein [Albimonas donghaensis]SDX52078.1 hypothetical protein SAMN05444336_10663 [Albimonas donghaensis]